MIELLVVMLVIAILSGITISVTKYASWRARKAKSDIEIQKIKSALEEYRAVYGEYPVVGDSNHYTISFEPDPETSQNVPPAFRKVNLVQTTNIGTNKMNWDADTPNCNPNDMLGVENLPFSAAQGAGGENGLDVDYRLTYPLTIRPKLEGRPPFMDFPKVTVCYLAWKNVLDALARGYIGTNIYYKDKARTAAKAEKRTYIKGDPINRVVAVDPLTGHQWAYQCLDGRTYTLQTIGPYPGSVSSD